MKKIFSCCVVVWMIIISVIFTVVSYLYLDKPLSAYIHSHALSAAIPGLYVTSYIGRNIVILICVGFFIVYARWLVHSSRKLWQGWFIFCCVFLSNLVAGVFKIGLGRARPELWLNNKIFGFYGPSLQGDFWSFPSGHTVSVMSAVVACFLLWPRWRLVYFLLGLGLVVSRVILLKHFLSDVIFGSLIGTFISWGLYYFFFRFKIDSYKKTSCN